MPATRLIAVIGGTGAQGIPVVRDLVKSGNYTVRALTRDTTNARFKELQSYGPVEGVVGTFASEESLRATFRGAWGAFVNIDGFNSGEKTEIFWTIRAWELAIEEGVKFFVLGNLDYAYKLSGFRPEFHAGHYDGKGRIGEWILAQNKDALVRDRMRSALFTTGPYIEMTLGAGTPFCPTVEDGVAIWRVPLANGAVPFVALVRMRKPSFEPTFYFSVNQLPSGLTFRSNDDCGHYVKWLFDQGPDGADGLDLRVAVDHITFDEYTRAFTKVTGKPARWIDTDLDKHMTATWGSKADDPAGYNAPPDDPSTMSLRSNFTAFFQLWRNSGDNKGIIRRDYQLLDKIHPQRIRTAEEWLVKENAKGLRLGLGSLWDRVQPENIGHVLKITEDGRSGSI
ncbi:NmrA family protein [Xylariaceae sp. FL1651]|nr:NmrA family protein [Xylariaceae sp. FL1651]